MLAAVFETDGSFDVKEISLRPLFPNEALVRVDSAMICATDVHIIAGEQPSVPPVVLGHEFAGVVEETGNEVTNVTVGDHVSVEPHKAYCGKCKFCRVGKPHMCLEKQAYGVHLNGGFAQFAILPDYALYKVPKDMPMEHAALAENIGCCLHGMDRIDMQFGDSVLILGGGFVGMVMAQLSRLRGCGALIVSEPKAERREMLLKNGADVVVDPLSEDLSAIVAAHTEGLGVDVVIEAAGLLATARIAHTFAARAGKIMYYGLVPPGNTIELEPNEIFRKELTLMGSAINPNSHHQTLEIIRSLRLDGCVTHQFPLRDIAKGIEIAKKGESIKVCIRPNL